MHQLSPLQLSPPPRLASHWPLLVLQKLPGRQWPSFTQVSRQPPETQMNGEHISTAGAMQLPDMQVPLGWNVELVGHEKPEHTPPLGSALQLPGLPALLHELQALHEPLLQQTPSTQLLVPHS